MTCEGQWLDPMIRDMEARYDRLFAGYAKRPTLRQIWRDAYGDDDPEDVEPLSYVTRTDLHRLAVAVAAGPGHTTVDLGCGRGGPSLWIARQTGTRVVGIDVSSIGIAHATERAGREGLTGQARFQVGDVRATGRPAASVDAASVEEFIIWAQGRPPQPPEVRYRNTRRVFSIARKPP